MKYSCVVWMSKNLKEQMAENGIPLRYDCPRNQLSSMEKDIIDMESQLEAAWLLVLKAAWLIDRKKPSTVESSMSKLKSGDIVTRITQKGIDKSRTSPKNSQTRPPDESEDLDVPSYSRTDRTKHKFGTSCR